MPAKSKSAGLNLTLLSDTKQLSYLFTKWCKDAARIRVVVAWAGTHSPVFTALSNARNRIEVLVVGLDFHQTDPMFLRSFRKLVRIGRAQSSYTYHPKLYLFETDTAFALLIGSSNLTRGGFDKNEEANVCIEGSIDDLFYLKISDQIELFAKQSRPLHDEVLEDYEKRYLALAKARKLLAAFRPSHATEAKISKRKKAELLGSLPPSDLHVEWHEYEHYVWAQEGRGGLLHISGRNGTDSYLGTLDYVRSLWQKYRKLSNMPLRDRQILAGTIGAGGWFGSMKGAGEFKKVVNGDPAILDTALEKIPAKGPVDESQYLAYVNACKWPRANVSTISRLLAMKRPDHFVCVDSPNRHGLAEALGLPVSRLQTLDGYWDAIQRIWACPWHKNGPVPTKVQSRIWPVRVAMLDALYYDPS